MNTIEVFPEFDGTFSDLNQFILENEGWSLFEPETRARQRTDALQAFQRIERIISS